MQLGGSRPRAALESQRAVHKSSVLWAGRLAWWRVLCVDLDVTTITRTCTACYSSATYFDEALIVFNSPRSTVLYSHFTLQSSRRARKLRARCRVRVCDPTDRLCPVLRTNVGTYFSDTPCCQVLYYTLHCNV